MANHRTTEVPVMHHMRADPDIPGTVDMSLSEGEESAAYGLALYPVPTDDPNDPLQYCAGLLGCALSNSYDTLLGFRMLHAFASSVCEALPAQVVADVFFLHERGKALGWYTFALTTGTLSAVAASYMLAGGHSYNLFFWVEFGIGCLLLLSVFFLFEETMFFRDGPISDLQSNSDGPVSTEEGEDKQVTDQIENQVSPGSHIHAPRDSYLQQLKVVRRTDPNSPILMMMIRSFTYFVIPPVFWENTGLVAVSAFLGYLAAAGPFSGLPDRFSARLTKKNNNIYEAEYRLWCLVVVMFISPASLILYGYSADKQLHWFGLVFAVGLFQFGAFFYLTYTLAYAMDSYESNIPEMLIAMNIGKQAISFGFGYEVINWITKDGRLVVDLGDSIELSLQR
ncbi:hypothetical protein ACJZ2D_014062 [Fusarium nematophilum]